MKYKSIPDKIKVGVEVYEVEYVNPSLLDGDAGKVAWSCNKIWINETYDEIKAQITLIHEILHAIHCITRFTENLTEDDKDKAEEDVINRLDAMLVQVLKDNKLRF